MYLQIQKAYEEIQILKGLKQKATSNYNENQASDFKYESARPNNHFYKENFDSFNEQHQDFSFKIFRRAYKNEEFDGFKG